MPSPPRRSLVEYRVGWQNDDGEKKEREGEEESKAGARPTSVVFIDASRPPMLLEAAPRPSSFILEVSLLAFLPSVARGRAATGRERHKSGVF